MSLHTLEGRQEQEVLWHQRRSFLQAAAAWTAMGLSGQAGAQSRSNIVQLVGDATLNGERLSAQQTIQTGDELVTGPKSMVIFSIGTSAFLVRQDSRLQIERGLSITAVGFLRLVTGAVASVWGPGRERKIITPTMTVGIRGTGVYTEVFPEQGNRTYFCNCYGTVDLKVGAEQVTNTSQYHTGFWGEVQPKGGRMITPAKALNHTDEEMEMLARLVDQRTAWQISGKKGQKDTSGY